MFLRSNEEINRLLCKGMLNIYLNSYHWAKLTFLKDFFKSKKSVSRSLFGNPQLTQILLNFKTFWWNLKIRGLPANIRLGEDMFKTCWRWLQSNIFLPFKTSCKHVLHTSWRRLGKWKIVYTEDAFKTSSRHIGKQEMFFWAGSKSECDFSIVLIWKIMTF